MAPSLSEIYEGNTTEINSMSPAEKATRNLNDAVGQLISAFDILNERLRPVSMPVPTAPSDPSKPDISNSLLVSSINEEARRLYILVDRIRTQVQELEV